MNINLSKGFKERIQKRFERFDMEVGVLTDAPHLQAKDRAPGATNHDANLSSFAGGRVRKKSRTTGPLTISEVSQANRSRLGVNFYTDPFKKNSSDIIKFSKAFFQMASGKSTSLKKRCENLLQAIVRNPILRGEYGSQARSTTRSKGFFRPMIDTAQLFKAIKASVRIKP